MARDGRFWQVPLMGRSICSALGLAKARRTASSGFAIVTDVRGTSTNLSSARYPAPILTDSISLREASASWPGVLVCLRGADISLGPPRP